MSKKVPQHHVKSGKREWRFPFPLSAFLLTCFLAMPTVASISRAEVPGEFRPKPNPHPVEDAVAKGTTIQPADTLPVSRAPLVNTAQRKPKLAHPGQPALRGNELVFNAGWELIEAPRLTSSSGTGISPVRLKTHGRDARATDAHVGAALSKPGVNTRDWYDATVPGTVLTTLVDQGVYPDPYFGLNNMLIPESLNKQDYWYRTEFVVPKNFSGRQLTLQFKGINYYAEVWFNGEFLGHLTGAFIRGNFDVTKLARPGGKNVLAVMVAPPPDPGIPQEESIKFGPGDNGGALCMDGPSFMCTEGWDWIPSIRDRATGLWQDVILRATGPVTIGDPQVITVLEEKRKAESEKAETPFEAHVTIETELRNASTSAQQGILRGEFVPWERRRLAGEFLPESAGRRDADAPRSDSEVVKFEQPVTLAAGETKTISFAPKDFPQLAVKHPRLWWPNGYGKPELYDLQLSFATADKKESDRASARFGIRQMSYEFGAKKPDGKIERFEFTPVVARASRPFEANEKRTGGTPVPVIDNRRDTMVWGMENKKKRDDAIRAAGGEVPTTPFHWGRGQYTTVALYPGAKNSPALKPVAGTNMGSYLVVKVNGRRIECLGGDWGMDDAMKRVSRERLEPYIRLHRDANLNMILNWAGQSTSEAFYDLCDEYGILVWNDFWLNTEFHNYRAVDNELFLGNFTDSLKRFRNHPSIALWCSGNEGVPVESLHQEMDRLIRELDGTRYYQPNSRLVNVGNSGPWSNVPMEKYFKELNKGFTTELGASSIPSAEVMRSMMPEADLWPIGDTWTYHDLHSKGAADRGSTLERMSARFGEPRDLEDLCRKAQLLNYETYRAIFEGFNSRLWNDCSGVIIWMSHPSWPSTVMQLYTWDYDPNGSLFGAKKGAEPVHIQMNPMDCKVSVINREAKPLENVTAKAAIYDLSGRIGPIRTATLTAAADACTDVLTLDWPAKGAHLAKLELRDKRGALLSENFYWHARDEKELQQLNSMPQVKLDGKLRVKRGAVEGRITNSSETPALAVRLTLRDAKTGQRLLPAYYDDNYVSLLPGESRDFRIEFRTPAEKPQVDLTGWNIEPTILR